jgi:hypothetical protein
MCVPYLPTSLVLNIFRSDKYLGRYARGARRNACRSCPIVTKSAMCRQILIKLPNIKLHKKPFCGCQAVTRGQRQSKGTGASLQSFVAKAQKNLNI